MDFFFVISPLSIVFKIKGAISGTLLCFSNVKTCRRSIKLKINGPFFVI